MGYNATEIITRFVQHAGQPDGYEPGKRKGAYRQRFLDGSGSSLYYARDRQGRVTEIQSYGPHFPLAHLLLHPSGKRRMWLLNGDRWPGGGFARTNEHNDIARAAAQASGTPCFTVPFSALREAGIELATIKPVHTEPETYTYEDHSAATLDEVPEAHRKRHVWIEQGTGQVIEAPVAGDGREAWPDYSSHTWEIQEQRLGENGLGWYKTTVAGPDFTDRLISEYASIEPGADELYHWTTERHWLGASLFRARYRENGYRPGRVWTAGRPRWACFVTAFDYNEPAPLWFMSELPRGAKPAAVAEAIDALKPDAVRDAEAAGIPVLRQGDVFIIAQPGTTERELLAAGGELVPSDQSWGRNGRYVNDSHTATRVVQMPDGTLFARGIMRHRPERRRPDHAALKLWDRQTWGRVVLNAQARSFDNSPRSWSRGGDVD